MNLAGNGGGKVMEMADGKVMVLRVPRERVVGCAEQAIKLTREEGYTVSTRDVRRLMRVARSAPEFLLGGWNIERCGCLVGNLLGHMPKYGSPLTNVGLRFDDLLEATLTARQHDRYATRIGETIVRVVD